MKITVINNKTSGNIPCIDASFCAPATTKVMTNRTRDELSMQSFHANGNQVLVIGELEAMDLSPLICDMKSPADPAGGATTCAACGFDVETTAGSAFAMNTNMYLGVFDDVTCKIPSVTGSLATAATGTIVSGSGTNLLVVTPASGVVSVTLTKSTVGTVYVKAWPTPAAAAAYSIDCSETDSVTFTP